MNILGIFFVVSLLVSLGYYFALLHKGVIKDKNKNFIPDNIDNSVSKAKSKKDSIKKEIKDVANAITGDNPQVDESKEEQGK